MSEKQTIIDLQQAIDGLLMEVAKLRKDNEYLTGEVAYWKQQASVEAKQRLRGMDFDQVVYSVESDIRRCIDDSDSREKLIEDIRDFSYAVTNVDEEYYGEIVCDVIRFIDRQAAITKKEAYQRGYDDGLHANTKAAFSMARQAFGIRKPKKYNLAHESKAVNYKNDDSLQDSREKLEADAMDFCKHFYTTERRYDELIRLLKQQAAITERELISQGVFDLGTQQRIIEQDRSIVEYAERVGELEAELDTKQGALDIAVKNESNLEQRIIELEKENDRLMQKVADAKVGAIGCPAYIPETHYCKWHCADFELNNSTLLKLRQDNYALRNERDELREKLSQAIGHAHNTIKLVNLDGECV